MSRRIYKRCLLWLLPLLVAQALVPVGFMVAGAEGSLRIEFCPVQSAGVIAALGQTNHAADDHSSHHRAHAAHHGPNTSGMQADASADVGSHHARSNSCPFALAATAISNATVASTATIALIEVDVVRAPKLSPLVDLTRFSAHRVRGPPHLI